MADVVEIADEPEGNLQSGLADLRTAEFLYETRLFPDREYTFKHALTHEVVYRGILQDRRRDLHRRIAEAIESVFADRLPEEVFARPKKGFEVPIADWLVGPLADLTRRAIDPGRLKRQELFRPELPARWFAELEAGRRDTSWELWTMVAFQAWHERHLGLG